ncbi:MAG: hypothetical protein RR135_02885 [Oscillospiraceae bacterium]
MLLGIAGQKLGCDPQTLKNSLQNGHLDQITQGMPVQQKQNLTALLKNPQAMSQLLGNPQVKQMIEQITKGK